MQAQALRHGLLHCESRLGESGPLLARTRTWPVMASKGSKPASEPPPRRRGPPLTGPHRRSAAGKLTAWSLGALALRPGTLMSDRRERSGRPERLPNSHHARRARETCCRRAVGTGPQVPTPPPDFCRLPCPPAISPRAWPSQHPAAQPSQHRRPSASGQGAGKWQARAPSHLALADADADACCPCVEDPALLGGPSTPTRVTARPLSQTQQIHKRLAAHPGCRIV